jgi:hypothetical protein
VGPGNRDFLGPEISEMATSEASANWVSLPDLTKIIRLADLFLENPRVERTVEYALRVFLALKGCLLQKSSCRETCRDSD